MLSAGREHGPGREGGQMMVLFALMLVVLLGFTALSVDVGLILHERRNAQNAVDAAALAGVSFLPTSTSNAAASAKDYANRNGLGNQPSDTVTTSFSQTYVSNDTITVTAGRPVPFLFGRVLGFINAPVSAKAVAVTGVAGYVYGVIPWAVNNDTPVTYGTLSSLQSVGGGGSSGTFNFVSITPPGSQSYADAMASGTIDPILAKQKYPTNTFDGSKVSPETAAALNARIAARPKETWETTSAGSPRVIVVPFLDGNAPNPPTPVNVTTFLALFLESVDTSKNVVWVRPVRVILPVGGIGTGVLDKGVRVVKLIK